MYEDRNIIRYPGTQIDNVVDRKNNNNNNFYYGIQYCFSDFIQRNKIVSRPFTVPLIVVFFVKQDFGMWSE